MGNSTSSLEKKTQSFRPNEDIMEKTSTLKKKPWKGNVTTWKVDQGGTVFAGGKSPDRKRILNWPEKLVSKKSDSDWVGVQAGLELSFD